eukprot:UN32271
MKNEFNFLYTKSHKSTPLLEDLFLLNGRIEHLDSFLCLLPEYAEKYFHIRQSLMLSDDGPLPIPWRQYIAIMAASRYGCTYLIQLHEHLFLKHGGDIRWLKGLAYCPTKLQKLAHLNAILAHQPWRIEKSIISKLLDLQPKWQIRELIHAVIIMTFYHMLASICEGFQISTEYDLLHLGSHTKDSFRKISSERKRGFDEAEKNNKKLLNFLRKGEDNIKVKEEGGQTTSFLQKYETCGETDTRNEVVSDSENVTEVRMIKVKERLSFVTKKNSNNRNKIVIKIKKMKKKKTF